MSDRAGLVDALFPHFRAAWIVYEDVDLVAIDKPYFLSTHAPEADRTDDARSRLGAFLEARDGSAPYLGVHQRLDKGTSGVLCFTRRREANPSIARQFERREVRKVYLAAVEGRLPARGTLRHRLAPGEGGAMRVVGKGGVEAITRFEVVARGGRRALVRCTPETGRTHQIRVQLAAAGAPVAGDARYGGPAAARLLLHAEELALAHPATGARIVLR
ncbi:MAG TPA: RNA pseudouridine synthase, partial [Minicystis sp.]|nr:RNA pseudouridine synthase [Minicystis sp.]